MREKGKNMSNRFEEVSFSSFLLKKDEAPEPWSVENVLESTTVALLGGHPKKGKTLVTIDLILSMGASKPFLNNFPVVGSHRILIFSPEGSRRDFIRRVLLIAEKRGIDLKKVVIDELRDKKRLNLLLEEDRRIVWEKVMAFNPTLFVIDPFVNCFVGSVSSQPKVRTCLDFFDEINKKGISVLITHHYHRSAKGGAESLMGSDSFRQWYTNGIFICCDLHGRYYLTFEHRNGESGGEYPIRFEKVGKKDGYFVMDIGRAEAREEKRDIGLEAGRLLSKTPARFFTTKECQMALKCREELSTKAMLDLVKKGIAEYRARKGYRFKLSPKHEMFSLYDTHGDGEDKSSNGDYSHEKQGVEGEKKADSIFSRSRPPCPCEPGQNPAITPKELKKE